MEKYTTELGKQVRELLKQYDTCEVLQVIAEIEASNNKESGNECQRRLELPEKLAQLAAWVEDEELE